MFFSPSNLAIDFRPFAVNATGFLSVHHYPDSIEFKGNDELSSDLISDVFLASLGYTIDGQGDFDGLRIRNPFNMPKSALIVQVDGIDKLNFVSTKSQEYPIFGASVSNSLDLLNSRVSNHVNVDFEDHLDTVNFHENYLWNFPKVLPIFADLSNF